MWRSHKQARDHKAGVLLPQAVVPRDAAATSKPAWRTRRQAGRGPRAGGQLLHKQDEIRRDPYVQVDYEQPPPPFLQFIFFTPIWTGGCCSCVPRPDL